MLGFFRQICIISMFYFFSYILSYISNLPFSLLFPNGSPTKKSCPISLLSHAVHNSRFIQATLITTFPKKNLIRLQFLPLQFVERAGEI